MNTSYFFSQEMSDLQYEPVSHPAAEKVSKECSSPVLQSEPLRVQPSGCIMTPLYPELAQKFLDFEVREDDVWIVTFPKCGNCISTHYSIICKKLYWIFKSG